MVDLHFPQMQKPNKNLKNPQKDLLCVHPFAHTHISTYGNSFLHYSKKE
jgi:hypothetical protein